MSMWIKQGLHWQKRGYNLISEFRRAQRRRRARKHDTPIGMDLKGTDQALQTLKDFDSRDWQRIHLDNKYWTCTKPEFQKILEANTLNEKQYVLDQFDCDNFAFNLKAQVARDYGLNNVGMVIDNSAGHAYNVVIFKDGTAELLEPQSDRWITPGESKMYSFEKGIIIL